MKGCRRLFMGICHVKQEGTAAQNTPWWWAFCLINAEMPSGRAGRCHTAPLQQSRGLEWGKGGRLGTQEFLQYWTNLCWFRAHAVKPYSIKKIPREQEVWEVSNVELKRLTWFSCPALCVNCLLRTSSSTLLQGIKAFPYVKMTSHSLSGRKQHNLNHYWGFPQNTSNWNSSFQSHKYRSN